MKLVSVIIPVFNAECFVENAVKSAFNLKSVGEVILVEDGSTDDSFEVCQRLSADYKNVRLLYHANHKNCGAGASRNLGITSSNFPYIAFLDADDQYLPRRFDKLNDLIRDHISFDGIYEAAKYMGSDGKIFSINNDSIPPSKLFHYLLRGTYGHFCTNSITVKKQLLIRAGMFNESLRLHQDSELWLRLAHFGNLIAGNIVEPVALIRRHEGNRVWKGTTIETRITQWKATWDWAKKERVGVLEKMLIIRKLVKLFWRYRLKK
ncbi:hypothetical protein GCM10007049_00590 [Echinicola pacifica]|uniref:Glycosyltransferase 2-like domain-containing protein n=1 Tax=Echinicola pacifica TaxID=346377 RepID=A0A918UIG0_9BACT|nr:glycosyltransferase family 2 protein [Echinicola pacifica]GGZ12779.1 hypothetical protein GCM10007049_00590 [Echinicola pacifica]